MEDKIVGLVVFLVEGCKNEYAAQESGTHKLWACKYLLNQVLRQINVPPERWYVSIKAKELWSELSDDDFFKYTYNNKVAVKKDYCSKQIGLYKGAQNQPYGYLSEEQFAFNDIFHDDHIVPISVIEAELIALENPTTEAVSEIIDSIRV